MSEDCRIASSTCWDCNEAIDWGQEKIFRKTG